jgi:DNA-binding MarR family transcriptional regulator
VTVSTWSCLKDSLGGRLPPGPSRIDQDPRDDRYGGTRDDTRGGEAVSEQAGIRNAKEAADHELILAFGRLQGAANRLEYILGRALEVECGISHLMFEVLLILGRADTPGLSMRAIAQEQVLTTGGATRLVDRMEAAGLVARTEAPDDRRAKLVRLTPLGEETTVRASRVHVENIKRYFVEPLPAEDRERFAEDLRILSHSARDTLPRLP